MRYFAYGSNMQWERMKERCPTARFVCRALLPDHRVIFPTYSENNGCWTASIEKARGRQTWGIVYEIDDRDIPALNAAEGYRPHRTRDKNAYIQIRCNVLGEGEEERPLVTMTYVANGEGSPPASRRSCKAPNAEYKARLVAGARHWRLPEAYIKQLEAIESVNDIGRQAAGPEADR